MRALVFHGPKKVSVDVVPDPRIEEPTDAIVRVTSTAICGSDLHIYHGLFSQPRPLILGHEFMGFVEEVGAEVKKVAPGDRVIVPFAIACGSCWFCRRGGASHCERTNPEHYGPEGGLDHEKGGGLFGFPDLYGGYAGGQAELVRVPHADVGPRPVPPHLTDEQAVLLTDVIPTGFSSVRWAELAGGESVAVLGCGPIGLMAMRCAWLLGASVVLGVDPDPYRRDRARALGADTFEAGRSAVEGIRAATGGRGADLVIDAVGVVAHARNAAREVSTDAGSIDALRTAASAVRRGGNISIVGVYGASCDAFPLGQIFDKGLRLNMGPALVHHYMDELIPLVASGKLRGDDLISHRLPLGEAARAYQMFSEKEDRCIKVVLSP